MRRLSLCISGRRTTSLNGIDLSLALVEVFMGSSPMEPIERAACAVKVMPPPWQQLNPGGAEEEEVLWRVVRGVMEHLL